MSKRVRLADGSVIEFPDDMSDEDMNAAIQQFLSSELGAEASKAPEQPKIRVALLKSGQKVTEKGPEYEYVEDINDPRLTDGQREALQGMIDRGEYSPNSKPGSFGNPVFKQQTEDGSGKKRVPRAPSKAMVVEPDGLITTQKPKKSHTLGFTTGVRRATGNVREFSERETARRKDIEKRSNLPINIPSPIDLAMEGFSKLPDTRESDRAMLQRARQTGVEPSMIGDVVGSAVGTYPYVAATRSPIAAGAAAGALNTEQDTLEGVAIDALIGAGAGKIADSAIQGVAKTISPQVDPSIRRLADRGVDLTPGQVMGGTMRNLEETLAGFPLVGGLVGDARQRAIDTFNRSLVDEVLNPLARPIAARSAAPATAPAANVPAGPAVAGPTGAPAQALPAPTSRVPAPTGRTPATTPADDAAAGVPGPRTATDVGPETGPRLQPGGQGTKEAAEEFVDATAEKVGKTRGGRPSQSSLPEDVETGNEALTFAYNQIRNAYDDVIPKMSVTMDDAFMADITRINSLTNEVTPELAQVFQKTMRDRLVSRLETPGAKLTGDDFKDLTSYLGNQAREFGRSQDPMQRKLGALYDEASNAVKEMAKRQNPQQAERLSNIDEAYSMLLRVERAAAKNPGGVVSGNDLRQAVQQMDRSSNKRATAQGRSVLQESADDAAKILGARSAYGSQVPSRALLMGGGAAAVAGQSGLINPLLAGIISAPLLTYSRSGGKLIRNAMLKRPKGADKARAVVEATQRPMSIAAGAQAAYSEEE